MHKEVDKQAVKTAFQELTGTPKDIFYYVLIVRYGRFSFSDLIGNGDHVNKILKALNVGVDSMHEIHVHGFTLLPEYRQAFMELFSAEIENGTYTVPKYTRTPMI